ncbi:MAG: hypothetical protein EBX52_12480, partial [Proteobacteria bacterium]|nr:hypothetical protein [Pseudomonadota bacterium]
MFAWGKPGLCEEIADGYRPRIGFECNGERLRRGELRRFIRRYDRGIPGRKFFQRDFGEGFTMKAPLSVLVLLFAFSLPAHAGVPSWCSDTCRVTTSQACAVLKSYDPESKKWVELCSAPVGLDGAYEILDGDGSMKADLSGYPEGSVGVFISGGSDFGFSPYRRLISFSDLDWSPDQVHVNLDSTLEAASKDAVMKEFFDAFRAEIKKQISGKGSSFSVVTDSNLKALSEFSDVLGVISFGSDSTSEDAKRALSLSLPEIDHFEKTGSFRNSSGSLADDLVAHLINGGEWEIFLKNYEEVFLNFLNGRPIGVNEFRDVLDAMVPAAVRSGNRRLVSYVKDQAELSPSVLKSMEMAGVSGYWGLHAVNPELAAFLSQVRHGILVKEGNLEQIRTAAEDLRSVLKVRCKMGSFESCSEGSRLEVFREHLQHLIDAGAYSGYADLNTGLPEEVTTGIDYQAVFDGWFSGETPRFSGEALQIQRLVAIIPVGEKREFFKRWVDALPLGRPDEGGDLVVLGENLSKLSSFAISSNDPDLAALVEPFSDFEAAVVVPLAEAGVP